MFNRCKIHTRYNNINQSVLVLIYCLSGDHYRLGVGDYRMKYDFLKRKFLIRNVYKR